MPKTKSKIYQILKAAWFPLSFFIAITLVTYISPVSTPISIHKRTPVSQFGFEQSMIRFAVNLSNKKDSIMFKNGFSSLDIESGLFKFTKGWQKGHFGRLKINEHLFVEFISPKPYRVKEMAHNERLTFVDISAPICVSLNKVGTCGHISVVATPVIKSKNTVLIYPLFFSQYQEITTQYIYEW